MIVTDAPRKLNILPDLEIAAITVEIGHKWSDDLSLSASGEDGN
jgi:hypothetical protein